MTHTGNIVFKKWVYAHVLKIWPGGSYNNFKVKCKLLICDYK